MRILSQDLRCDFPYEKVCISITGNGNIIAQDTDGSWFPVAQYNNVEKAKRAMEMLHEAYEVHFIYQTMTPEQKAGFLETSSKEEQSMIYGIFTFPTDKEMEKRL